MDKLTTICFIAQIFAVDDAITQIILNDSLLIITADDIYKVMRHNQQTQISNMILKIERDISHLKA